MIKTFDNFLPTELFNRTSDYAMRILTKQRGRMLFSSYTWGQEVVHDSPPVLAHPLPLESELYKPLHDAVYEKCGAYPGKNQILFYYWPVHSYIPWHNDGEDPAVTVHLNRQWDVDKGGLFLYNEGEGIRGIVPKPNLGVFQTGGTQHATTPVLPRGKLRCTLQVWLKK